MSAPDAEHAQKDESSSAIVWREEEAACRSVAVEDASRVLECAQVQRQLRLQHLVRHYLVQILHGCRSAYCDTPTCLSARKRNPSRPLRPPTQLTARALAHYLASQDKPHQGLCPHELKVSPASLEIDGAIGIQLEHGRDGATRYSVYPAAWRLPHHMQAPTDWSSRGQNKSRGGQHVVDAIKQRHQTRKDTKSLSQNLFDSVTMIFAYSKQIPSVASVFETLRTANSSVSPAESSFDSVGGDGQTQNDTIGTHVADAARANSAMVSPHVNDRVHVQHSQQNLGGSRPTPTSPSPTETLHSGQQVHRIPYDPHESAPPSRAAKPGTYIALDGAYDSPKLSISKTGKKNFTLGSITTDMGRTGTPQLPLKHPGTVQKRSALPGSTFSVSSALDSKSLEKLKDDVYSHPNDQLHDDFNFAVELDTNRRIGPAKPSANRSLFYILSNADTLLKSFRESNKAFEKSPLPHLDSAGLVHSFRDWNRRNGALIFDSLWVALEDLFIPPPELHAQKSPRLRPSRKRASAQSSAESPNAGATTSTSRQYLSNLDAAHIIIICIHALTSLVPVGWPHTWAQLRKFRAWGVVVPDATPETDEFRHPYLSIIDGLEYEPAIRLAERLLHAIGARTCFEHILATINQDRGQDETDGQSPEATLVEVIVLHLEIIERVALASKRRMTPTNSTNTDPGWTVTATLIEWLKTIITKKWDSKVQISKWSSVGSSVMLLARLSKSCGRLNLRESMFDFPFLNERLDMVEDPLKFLTWKEQPNTLHVFQYPMFFRAEYVARYFRTINFSSMMAQYDQTTRTQQMQRSLKMFLSEIHEERIKRRMKVTLSNYLILEVSRDGPLRDTLDQLWNLEKRVLLKPLKVKMGEEEGELGDDHGGVTYEFFRVVLSEAFKPDHGMFTLEDEQTRITWFQPNTLEPDWKFEMIGVLFSLAIYNGITLPVTFPLIFYRFLLPAEAPLRDWNMSEDSLENFREGWPGLASKFDTFLEWANGDVADVYMLNYTFSYEPFGQRIHHNMDEPYPRPRRASPNSPAIRPEDLLTTQTKEAKPVTNENREQFVRDSIHHRTYLSVAPQLHAFRKGFMACLHPKSLHFFSPHTLRKLIEGEKHISIQELRKRALYDNEYSPEHPTVQMFWRVVERYSQEDRRHLLEFVTASDRIPVTGYDGITFIINYSMESDRLPTSSTCFGRLYLPEYQDEEVLRAKLELAIRNSKGFGLA